MGLEVNSYSGSLFYTRTDLYMPGKVLPLDFTFSYSNSYRRSDFGFGLGFTMPYSMNYYQDSIFTVVVRADGRKDKYRSLEGQTFIPPTGYFDKLEKYDGEKLRLVTKDGTTYEFAESSHKKLTGIKDRYGNAIQINYTDSFPTSIVDASGRTISLRWVNGHLAELIDANESPSRSVSYAYDGEGNLIQVTDFEGKSTRYRYDAPGNLIDVIDPKGNIYNIIYNRNRAVEKLCSPVATQTLVYNTERLTTYLVEEGISGKQTTAYQFDDKGRVIKKTGNCCGYNVGYSYDEDNNVARMTDANGNEYSYTYDSRGNQLSETDPLGNTSRTTYEETYNQVTSITDKNGNRTAFEYDDVGNVTTITDALQVTESFTYNEFGQPSSYTDGRGNVARFSYDRHGNLTETIDQEGGVTTWIYNARSQLVSTTDPEGHKTGFTYDKMGRILSRKDPKGNEQQFGYDANGNLEWTVDANGNRTTFGYDVINRLVSVTDALGGKTTYGYDGQNNRIAETDPNGNTLSMLYDNLNRVSSVTNAAGEVTTYEYDGNGNLLSMALPGGNIIMNTYDAANRLLSADDGLGSIAFYEYDKVGNLLSETDANGNATKYAYDAAFRLNSTTDPLGNTTVYEYDQNDNQLSLRDAMGNTTAFEYDRLDRLVKTTDALGNVTASEYDKNGNLIKLVDANNNSTEYSYDALGRLIREKFADNSTVEMDYDPAGNLVSKKDGRGQETTYSYDKLNRLTKRDYPNSPDDDFAYDPGGRMVRASNSNAQLVFSYDRANRLISEELNGKTTAYRYDTPNRVRQIIYPSGRQITEQRDIRERIQGISEGNSFIAQVEYDLADRKTAQRYGNGTLAAFQYDNNNQVIAITQQPNGFLDYRYTYDKVGNRLTEEKRQNPLLSQAYTYDAIYRLVQSKTGRLADQGITSPTRSESFDLDAVGNRISWELNGTATSYQSNKLNAYTQAGSTPWQYDGDGNLTNNGTFSFAYDDRNKLESVNGGDVASYQYDPLGRRIRKQVGEEVTEYYYDGQRVIEEHHSGTVSSYVYGTWIDDVLRMDKAGEVFYYHKNALGSVTALSDRVGQVLEYYEYDPFGAVTFLDAAFEEIAESTVDNPYLFTGRRWDKEIGLYYYRNRHYDPEHGRFLQRDPLGYVDGMGLYEYVMGNPVLYIDVFGENIVLLIGAAIVSTAAHIKRVRTVYKAVRRILIKEMKNKPQKLPERQLRPDITLKGGGRSGQFVKHLEGPPNCVVKGSEGRIFITNTDGKVIWDITKDRAKRVNPGQGFSGKVTPVPDEFINLIDQMWPKQ